MKVYINGVEYDSERDCIIIELSPENKELIRGMLPSSKWFAVFAEDRRSEVEAMRSLLVGEVVEPAYFIQNGWVGDFPLWWRRGRAGYTCNVMEAHRFSKAEVEAQLKLRRPGEYAWPCRYVETCRAAHINVVTTERLDHTMRLSYKDFLEG